MKPYLIYVLEMQCSGLAAELRLNGQRVFREPGGATRFTNKKLDPWLCDGKNELELRAQRVPASAAPYLKVALMGSDGGEDLPGDEDYIVRYEWLASEQPLEEDPQVLLARQLDLGPVRGPWAWQTAQPYTEADRPAVEGAMAGLHALLKQRDEQGYVAAMRVKMEEMSRALHVPATELESDLHDWLQELFRQHDWQMADLNASTLRIEPGAEGRLVTVTDRAGGPPLRGQGSTSEFEAPDFTLSRLPQGWTVVR